MRKAATFWLALCVFGSSSHAAWVWMYSGEKHVLLPPEEGQPPWARFPDGNGDGKPDPVITQVHLRIEDTEGQTINRTRLGRTIRLVAIPELGGLELEPLSVTFRLSGPHGDAEVVPDQALREAIVLGTAPPVFVATYAFPEPPNPDFVGEWQASVQVKVGETAFDTAARQRVVLRVLGPRESTVEKIGRTVRSGLETAGREVKEFGEKVASEVEAWLERRDQEPVAGALKPVQPRETLGMVQRALRAASSPLAADESLLGMQRAAALRSRREPVRSVLVVPLDRPASPRPDGRMLVAYAVLEGLFPPGVTDPQSVPSWVCEGCLKGARLLLEGETGQGEGTVHVETAEGMTLGTISAKVEWFQKVLWPGQTELRVQRNSGGDGQSLVAVTVVSAVPSGAVRVRFTIPLGHSSNSATPSPDAEAPSGHIEPT